MSTEHIAADLERLIGLHRELARIAEEKKQVLIQGDMERLTRVLQTESQVYKQASAAEESRQRETASFLAAKGVRQTGKSGEWTVSDLIKLVFNAEEKRRLMKLQTELLGVIRELQEANELNRQLVEQSLAFVNNTLDFITESRQQEITYSHPGKQQAGTRKGFFDQKA